MVDVIQLIITTAGIQSILFDLCQWDYESIKVPDILRAHHPNLTSPDNRFLLCKYTP